MTIKFDKDKEVKISSWDLTKILSAITAVAVAFAKVSKYKYKSGGKKNQ